MRAATVRTLALVAGLCVATPAFAWERTQTCVTDGDEGFACRDGETPMPVAWPSTCVPWHLNLTGSSSIADEATVRAAVEASFDVWTDVDGSYLELVYAGDTDEREAGYRSGCGTSQNANVVMFIDEGWSHATNAVALTSLTYTPDNGRVYDADIEMNVENFPIGIVRNAIDDRGVTDLQNTLTHEVGHLVGLDHTQPDTFVAVGTQRYTQATMYAITGPTDTAKRTLLHDDEEGLRAAYPSSAVGDAEACGPVEIAFFEAPNKSIDATCGERRGCAAAAPVPAPGAVAFAVLALVGLRRRR